MSFTTWAKGVVLATITDPAFTAWVDGRVAVAAAGMEERILAGVEAKGDDVIGKIATGMEQRAENVLGKVDGSSASIMAAVNDIGAGIIAGVINGIKGALPFPLLREEPKK